MPQTLNPLSVVVLFFAAIVTVIIWVLPIKLGVAEAVKKGISPHWMWFGVHPLGGWITYVVIRSRKNPDTPLVDDAEGSPPPLEGGDMPLCVRTAKGTVRISLSQIEKLRASGKLSDQMKCLSVDGGESWLTWPEVAEQMHDAGASSGGKTREGLLEVLLPRSRNSRARTNCSH
jgi:hypothetical protein